MRTHFRIVPLALLIILLTPTASFALEPAGPMGVYVHRLDNGLTVLLTEHRESPRFYAEIVVRAGSKHDPAETTGLAHYLEHLLFKGTQRYGTTDFGKEKAHLDRIRKLYEQHFHEEDPAKRKAIYAQINEESQKAAKYAIPNEFDQVYDALGAKDLNAHTWQEETVYKASLPSNRLEQWAKVESERFSQPVLRLFQPELEVVYEEKNRSMDNKGRAISQAVERLLYKAHPYGQQLTIGEAEHLKKPSIQNIEAFYAAHYVPENMALILSGDFDKENAIEIIERYFSKWEAKPTPKTPSWKESPLQGVERVTVQYPAESMLIMSFRTEGRNHKDAEALRIVDMILDNSVAGLINLNLNETQRLRQAGSYPMMHNDYGAQYLWAIPKADQSLEEAEALLIEQLAQIKKGAFEDWILPAIVTDYKKHHMKSAETNKGRVNMLRDGFIAGQPWNYTANQIARMEKLTKDDVIRAANKYFGENYVIGHRVDGTHTVTSIEKPTFDSIDIDPTKRSVFMKEVLEMKTSPSSPTFIESGRNFQRKDMGNGQVLYHATNPINSLFQLTITLEMGSLQESRMGFAGLLLNKSGNKRFSSQELKKEWYKLGTRFDIETHPNRTKLKISGVDENLEASLTLLRSTLDSPRADQETLDALVNIQISRRKDSAKDPQVLSHALREYARFQDKSTYLTRLPAKQARKLTAKELLSLIQSLPGYAHTIEYTGPRSLDGLTKILEKDYPADGKLKAPPTYHARKMQWPEETTVYLFHKEAAQALAYLDFPEGSYDEATYPLIELYNDYFAGNMNSIVFQELRESRALAYTARARYSHGKRVEDENVMSGFIGTQADKTPEALKVFIDLIDNLPRSEARFLGSKTAIESRYQTTKTAFRSILSRVRKWERLEIPVDPRPNRAKAVDKLQIDDLFKFHNEHIANRKKVISIVGDKTKIGLDPLATLGKVEEVDLKTIFVF
jgi:predicted Zn-dependent peptidase